MKRGHSVRFCKIRKYFVPRGFMKWIPKGCEVSNQKNKSNGPTLVRGPNLVAWIHFDAGILEKHEVLSYLIKFLEEKKCDWNWIKGVYQSKLFQKSKEAFLITNNDSLKGLHNHWFMINFSFFKWTITSVLNLSRFMLEIHILLNCCKKATDCFLETTDCFSYDNTVKNWFNFSIHSVCCISQ